MFYTKLRNRLNQLKTNNLELIVEEDMFADRGKPLPVEANMYDHTVIKGLSPIRKQNGSENDYFSTTILKIWDSFLMYQSL